MMPDSLPRFNIAAVPVDAAICDAFFRAAAHFAPAAGVYCLHPQGALPHMTFCQFRAENTAHALALMSDELGREVVITNAGFYLRQDNPGQIWAMYVVRRTSDLVERQTRIANLLQAGEAKVLTKTGGDYFPHFTVANLEAVPNQCATEDLFSYGLVDRDITCRIRLGCSGEMGQFLGMVDGI
jgi:hypothetical protein